MRLCTQGGRKKNRNILPIKTVFQKRMKLVVKDIVSPRELVILFVDSPLMTI